MKHGILETFHLYADIFLANELQVDTTDILKDVYKQIKDVQDKKS